MEDIKEFVKLEEMLAKFLSYDKEQVIQHSKLLLDS